MLLPLISSLLTEDKSLDPEAQMPFIYAVTNRMIHQLTALILSCLMLVVSATSQVGLHFCQCEKTVFMGDCPCDEIPKVDEVTPCSCCESCESGDESVPETPNPCDDCDLTIDLEFDDCIPQLGNDYKIASEQLLTSFQSYSADESFSLQASEVTPLEIRGGPPPNLLRATTPLFLRHSEFLI